MSSFRNDGGAAALVTSRSQDVAGSPVAAAAVRRPAQPVANNCFAGPGTFTASSAGTVRSKHKIAVTCSGIQASWINWYPANPGGGIQGVDTPGAAAITINAALETADGTVHPMTFGGNALVTITPGSTATSDALPVTCNAGDIVYVRTNQPSSAGIYPTARISAAGCGGFAAGFNLALAGSGSIPNTSGFWGYGPSALLGVPAVAAPSVAVVGDSIAAGLGDSALNGTFYSEWALGGVAAGGYISRALTAAGIGHLSITHSGEGAYGFGFAADRQYRMSLIGGRCKYAICELGINDIYFGGVTLQQIQALLIAIWGALAADGMIVYQTTITPSTSSTDGWATVGNQTPTTNAVCPVIRYQLNDWIRAGAPVISATSLSPVVAGTSGALLTGQAGHPLTGYFEIAWLAESSHNAATWTVAGVRTVTDGTITLASPNTLTSTSAAWTAADVGKAVAVTGAGASGAILMTSVNAVSGNQATLNDAASTAVSGATVAIGVATLDGTHPSSALAAQLAAGINTAVLT